MSAPRTSSFLRNLQASGLVDEAQFAQLESWTSAATGDDRALARQLVDKGILTRFQAEQILAGRTRGFFVGPYVVLDKIGAGGMGQVYKARHRQLHRTVALKVLPKWRRADPEAQARFMREARASAQLEHPNIVTTYDVGEEGNITYLAMQYVEGQNLYDIIKQHARLDPGQAARIAHQVALALEHARTRGIVHRDVKPSNILIDTEGAAKVLDMGLARIEHGDLSVEDSAKLTSEGAVMGTVDYIAPEQARDTHAADIRADIYSLGCTLYHMLSGRVPFPGGTATEKLIKHIMDEPVPLGEISPHVPTDLADVVAKMMAKKVEDRYQTPADAAGALEPWVSSSVAQAPSGAAPGTPRSGPPSVSQTTPPGESVPAGYRLADADARDEEPPPEPSPTSPEGFSGVALHGLARKGRVGASSVRPRACWPTGVPCARPWAPSDPRPTTRSAWSTRSWRTTGTCRPSSTQPVCPGGPP